MAIALDTLAYARRLREAGFTAQQAEGQAEALAGAMTDTLVTKQDLGDLGSRVEARFAGTKQDLAELRHEVREIQIRVDGRFEHLEKHLDTRLAEQEKRTDARLGEQTAIVRGELADLERRMTIRLGTVTVAAISIVSAIVKLL
jgi:hypothetical protein